MGGRKSMSSSGNFGDTAKDRKGNLNTTLAYRVAILARRLGIVEVSLTNLIAGGPYIPSAEKGVANGVATLDGTGVLTAAQVPPYLLGALNYQGTWDASGGVAPADLTKGHYYVISVAGTIGGVDYFVGDLIAYNGTIWERIDGATEEFIHLVDTPANYTGESLKTVRVNNAESGLEFEDPIPNTIEVVESGNHGDYISIQDAINIANDGDVILIRNGVYTEDLVISKGITLKGECALETQLNGKITFSPAGDSKAVVSQIGIENTNDFCIDCQPANDNAILKCIDVRMQATWTAGAGVSSPTTAKSCVKLSRGSFINRGSAQASIVASGDSFTKNNTCIYWVTGTELVYLESFGVIHSVTNSTDSIQNIEIMFNNNSNANGRVIIKNGFCRLTGVVDVNNYIAPFYMYDSENTGYIDGNILFLFNSGHSYATFHYLGDATSEFSNNSIIHSGIPTAETYIARTLSTTGRIKIINNYYDVNFIPEVTGNVEYFYTISNGDTYHSKGFTGRVFTPAVFPVTIANNDGIHTVLVDATTGPRIVNLPDVTDNINRIISIKKTDVTVNTVTITPSGGESIDGAFNLVISVQYECYTLQSDGTNWWII